MVYMTFNGTYLIECVEIIHGRIFVQEIELGQTVDLHHGETFRDYRLITKENSDDNLSSYVT